MKSIKKIVLQNKCIRNVIHHCFARKFPLSLRSFSARQRFYSLADKGRTIIFTIHQPSYRIYKLFDTLTLIARGRTIYHGPADQALEYFSNIGTHVLLFSKILFQFKFVQRYVHQLAG